MRSTKSLQPNPPLPERAAGPAKRAGRPPGRHPDQTREHILDVAEALFAHNGYDGTSLRDVARAAALQTAAIGYHYPSKPELFDTVVRRRAEVMSAWRQRMLQDMRREHGSRAIPLEQLVRAYMQPFFESASHGHPGWRHYAALMGRLANSALGTEVISRHYDSTAQAYLQEFFRALPGVRQADVIDGFTFMVASMLALCADTGRAQKLASTGTTTITAAVTTTRPLSEHFSSLLTFLVAGFLALPATTATTTTKAAPAAPRARRKALA